MQIEITGSAAAKIRQLMADGEYASAAEVIEALLAREAAAPEPTRAPNGQPDAARRQYAAYTQLVEAIRPMEQPLPEDSLSGRDHDQILYRK